NAWGPTPGFLLTLASQAGYNARVLSNATPLKSAAPISKEDLCGIFLPITTPFLEEGAIDFRGLHSNIEKWNATGIRGYVLLGSTGERVNLSESEQLEVFREARTSVANDCVFIAGVGQQSTFATIREIEKLTRLVDIDALLIITPHFYRAAITQEALVAHYTAIADESELPIILYSMPALTGIKIEPQTAATLSHHPKIIGIKDSSNDIDGLRRTIELCAKDFAVLTGNGTVLHEAFAAGACGAILAVGCVAPVLCLEISRAMLAGERDRAEDLQKSLTPLAAAVTTRFGLGGLKAALDMIGYTGGQTRPPLAPADGQARAEIKSCLDQALDSASPLANVRLG
ncbi:MAG TPA: dihydrodipicolinate synthase family protein, partial [Pyrinomonadaceae bacterium]|nr:dihydrodipicolinate synthase family protein [Pyrinomonadaceae bacterium]